MLSLLLGGRRETGFKRQGENVFAFSLDAVMAEEHDYQSNITGFPVESGATISDHVVNEPEVITINGHVTNTPVRMFGGLIPRLGRGIEAVHILSAGASFGTAYSYFTATFDRIQDAFDTLVELRNTKALLTVVSGLKVYENMMITRLNFPRDRRTGQALDFTARLQRVLMADFQEVPIQPNEENAEQATPEVDAGGQPLINEPIEETTTHQEFISPGAIPVPGDHVVLPW